MTYVRILYDILEGVVCEGLGCFCIYMTKSTVLLWPLMLRRKELGILWLQIWALRAILIVTDVF